MSQSTLDQLRSLYGTNNGKKKVDDRFFKPEYGTTHVRFLPGTDDKLFIKKFGEHWLEGPDGRKVKFICRRETLSTADKREKCPICEAGFSLFNTGNEADKALGKKFMPSTQHYANVIVRGEDDAEDVGPKVWKFGKKLFEKIVSEMTDEKVDLSDTEDGMDFKIVKKKVQSGNNEYPGYDNSKINTRRGETPIDADDLENYVENMEDIHEMIDSELLSYKELKKAFLNLNTDGDEDESEEEATEVAEAPKKSTKKSEAKTEEFDEDAFLSKIKNVVNE